MQLTERQLYDYMKCPIYYQGAYQYGLTPIDLPSMNKLLGKVAHAFCAQLAAQVVPSRSDVEKMWSRICKKNSEYITDKKVDITVDIPQAIPDREIPPLMMITFVENAFKHGVSYQLHSFIHINIRIIEEQLHFVCSNSKVPQGEDHHGGLGLQNAKRRLDLIYGRTYHLDIRDEENTYTVNLTLPL